MVKDSFVYLFVGQDSPSKDIKIQKLRQEFLEGKTEQFNLDILYAKELNLRDLQERLLSLPIKAKKRIIVIKGAQDLKEDIKEFILNYVNTPHHHILLILDIDPIPAGKAGLKPKDGHDEFIRRIARHVQIFQFSQPPPLNTFNLSGQIGLKKADYALKVLNQLLKNGEKPERILGGLRYSCERDIARPFELRKKLKLLLNCDIDIKTGRLKPEFALERLVVRLCCL